MVKLIHPVNPKYVRVKGDWGSYAGHKGRDYGWVTLHPSTSREVRAAAPGKVVRVVTGKGRGRSFSGNYGYGNQVIIQHTDQAWTTYNHFSGGGIQVRVGQIVKAGHLLGYMGNTGDANGIHLHFEVRIGSISENNRVPVSPFFTKELPGKSVIPAPAAPASSEKFGAQEVTTAALNLRSSPSTKGKVIKTMPKSTSKNKYFVQTGRHSGDWVLTKTPDGKIGWAHEAFIVNRNVKTTANLNVRKTPGGSIITVAKKGTAVTILETPTSPNNQSAAWRKVKLPNGTVGWVHNSFLKVR